MKIVKIINKLLVKVFNLNLIHKQFYIFILFLILISLSPKLTFAQDYILEIKTDDLGYLNTYNLFIPLEYDNLYSDQPEPLIYNYFKLFQITDTYFDKHKIQNQTKNTNKIINLNLETSKKLLYDEYFDNYYLIYLTNFNISTLDSNPLYIELYNSNKSLVTTNILNFCNYNNICEPCLDKTSKSNTKQTCLISENIFTCPSDCTSGIEDNICDNIADGICDPDCYNSNDPDCINCNDDKCFSNLKTTINSCSELFGTLCPKTSNCIGGYFINNYVENNLGCCVDGFCDYTLQLEKISSKKSQNIIDPLLDVDYALSNQLPKKTISDSKYLNYKNLAYITFSLLVLLIFITLIVLLHNGFRKHHINKEFNRLYFEITFYLDKGYTYEQILNYYVNKKKYDEKFILSIIKKINEVKFK